MGYSYIHFFNIEYWYCVIISLFGAECTDAELSSVGVSGPSVSATAPTHVPGFWEWLFGGWGSSASGAANAAPPGFFGTIFLIVSTILGVLWTIFSILAFTLSFLLLILIIVSVVGTFLIRAEEHSRYGNLGPAPARAHPLRSRWQTLLESAMSADPKRWREAIEGGDQLLGELFTRLGYLGETTSDKIRQVPESGFANLPAAWEAHRIRNFVMAPKSHFILTQREAFRVMKLYERVLKEFDFI